jgi:CRP-like cAMP-binding protein
MISPETLRKYSIFAGLPDKELKQLANISEMRSFKEGQGIFEESGEFVGEAKLYTMAGQATQLMVITEGQVHLTYEVGLDNPVIVGTVVEGELLALSALIPPYHLTTSAVAKTDVTAICLEAVRLRELLDEDPLLGYRIYKGVAQATMSRLKDTRVELAATLA